MKDSAKEFLIDLALMTRDFDWIEEIRMMNFERVKREDTFVGSVNLNHSTEILAEIYNSLNSFKWNDHLGEKPIEFDSLPDFKFETKEGTKREHISPILFEIERCIGRKECLRWHHINNLNRTDERFEIWWDVNKDEDIIL